MIEEFFNHENVVGEQACLVLVILSYQIRVLITKRENRRWLQSNQWFFGGHVANQLLHVGSSQLAGLSQQSHRDGRATAGYMRWYVNRIAQLFQELNAGATHRGGPGNQ